MTMVVTQMKTTRKEVSRTKNQGWHRIIEHKRQENRSFVVIFLKTTIKTPLWNEKTYMSYIQRFSSSLFLERSVTGGTMFIVLYASKLWFCSSSTRIKDHCARLNASANHDIPLIAEKLAHYVPLAPLQAAKRDTVQK